MFQTAAFVLGHRASESACKSGFSILYSSTVFMDIILIDFQRQIFEKLVSVVQDLLLQGSWYRVQIPFSSMKSSIFLKSLLIVVVPPEVQLFWARIHLCFSYPSQYSSFILCYRVSIHLVFWSLSKTILYVAVDLLCLLEELNLCFSYAIILNLDASCIFIRNSSSTSVM